MQPYGQPGYGAPQSSPYGYQQQQQPYGQQPYGQPMGFRPAAPMGPPPGVSFELWNWFKAVDQDNSGQITTVELQQALMNGNWTPFNAETCRLMIGMFDKDHSGAIGVEEFAALWKYIGDWKNCFDSFDRDRSGSIDTNELQMAFRTFGYNLSPTFCALCVTRFDRVGRRSIKFDDFIQCCVMLHSLTESFKAKDVSRTGMVDLTYEQFLEMVLDNTLPAL